MSKYGELKTGKELQHGNSVPRVWKFVIVFIVVGIILLISILLFGGVVENIRVALTGFGGRILPEAVAGSIIAVFIAAVQSFILRDVLPTSKVLWFVLAALAGGCLGGSIGGFIENVTGVFSNLTTGIILGAIMGAIAGATSSLLQNLLMTHKEERGRWFVFSLISWSVVWAVGAGIGWSISGIPGVAITAGLIMIASGVSLAIYLPRTHIEF